MVKNLNFGEGEKSKVLKAIDLRKNITHADFEFTELYAEKKFFETFAFVTCFYKRNKPWRVLQLSQLLNSLRVGGVY